MNFEHKIYLLFNFFSIKKHAYVFVLDARAEMLIFSNDLVIFSGAVGDSDVVTALFVTFRIGLFSWKLFLVTTQNFKCYSEKRKGKATLNILVS